jgi:hypothetical protein
MRLWELIPSRQTRTTDKSLSKVLASRERIRSHLVHPLKREFECLALREATSDIPQTLNRKTVH